MWTLILVTILLAFSGVFYKAESAKFTSRPPRGLIKARIGDDVTLNWTFTLDSGEALLLYEVQYSKRKVFDDSAKRIAYIIQDTVTVMKNYKVSVEPSGPVTLHNVTEQERGYYKCTLSLANTVHSFSDTVEVYVGTPPVITSPSTSKMKLLEDDELNVSCDTQGNPSPVALWYRRKKNDLKILTYSRLQIKNVKRSDAGNYSCMATNIMATVEKSLTLEVLERPVVTSFFHTSSVDNVLYECESVTIICEVRDGNPPIKNISIYHENRLVYRRTNTFNGRKSERNKMDTPGSAGQLRLKQVRKKDEGTYYCIAENENGSSRNKTIQLKVISAPKNCERKRNLERSHIFPTVLAVSVTGYSSAAIHLTNKSVGVETRSISHTNKSKWLLVISLYFFLQCLMP